MTECCESIVEICFTIFSGSGFFTVLLYAPSMAKLRDEEFNFCNKIVILNVTVLSWLWLCALGGVIVTEGKEHEEKRENLLIKNNRSTVLHSEEGELI